MKRSLFSSEGRILEKNDQTPVTIADFGVQALVSLGNFICLFASIDSFWFNKYFLFCYLMLTGLVLPRNFAVGASFLFDHCCRGFKEWFWQLNFCCEHVIIVSNKL